MNNNSLRTDKTTSQDLSLASLSYTTSFARKTRVDQVLVHFSVAISEAITITLDNGNGSDYDTVLDYVVLVSETDYVFRPQGELILQDGDELKIACTNANTTGVAYVTIKSKEILK